MPRKKEPPPTLRKPMGVRVVALPFVWEVQMGYQVLIYQKGGGDYNPAPARQLQLVGSLEGWEVTLGMV